MRSPAESSCTICAAPHVAGDFIIPMLVHRPRALTPPASHHQTSFPMWPRSSDSPGGLTQLGSRCCNTFADCPGANESHDIGRLPSHNILTLFLKSG